MSKFYVGQPVWVRRYFGTTFDDPGTVMTVLYAGPAYFRRDGMTLAIENWTRDIKLASGELVSATDDMLRPRDEGQHAPATLSVDEMVRQREAV